MTGFHPVDEESYSSTRSRARQVSTNSEVHRVKAHRKDAIVIVSTALRCALVHCKWSIGVYRMDALACRASPLKRRGVFDSLIDHETDRYRFIG